MKILKLQAWDMQYFKKLEALLEEEFNWIWRSERLTAIITFIFWGSSAFISSITFGSCILMGIPMTARTVLSALATFRTLQDPIFALPDLLSVFAQGNVFLNGKRKTRAQEKVLADRVVKYLQEEELKYDAVTEVPRDNTGYDDRSSCAMLRMEIEELINELREVEILHYAKLDGTVRVSGRKAYVPQTAWILSGNIRDNILFGNSYDKENYEKTIQACALIKDLELFANGDLTEIDAHTGSQLFKDCVMGILKDKTVLYVTHQVKFLPAADLILVMQDGKIVQKGKFDELLQQNIGFEAIEGAHSQALEYVVNAESSSRLPSDNHESANSEDDFDTKTRQITSFRA
ncbi:hypothetical protein EJB05_48172, partial [Eragrostis curvula]